MEHTKRDTAPIADPQNDWQNAETGHFYATGNYENPDEEEDKKKEEDEDAGDWGHVDPAEGNSPFPDPNDPTAPGSAV